MKTPNLSNNLEPISYYISKAIKGMLAKGKRRVLEEDWDRVYLIDGKERTGKSLLAMQLGFFLDPTLNLDRIVYSGEEFSKAIDSAKKGQAIIFDEAFNGLGSSGATSKLNKLIISKLMECGQKNLFIFIVLPTFFKLESYAAIFRSQALFHVYTRKNGKRGKYRIYNYENKKKLYLLGRKMYSYTEPYIRKNYDFYGKYPLDESAYRSKKMKSLKDVDQSRREDNHKRTIQASAFLNILRKETKMTFPKISEALKEYNVDLKRTAINELALKTRKKPEIGGQYI